MSGETWVITGARGFLGRHVVNALAADKSVRLVGVGRQGSRAVTGVESYVGADLCDVDRWSEILDGIRPAVVLHMAGRTPPADADMLRRDNVDLTKALVFALERHACPVRLVQVGSAAELGDVPVERLPVDETCPPEPITDYGRTKYEASCVALQAVDPVMPIIGRLFNVFGPGQPIGQVFGRYATEMKREDADRPYRLSVTGLDHKRDFLDVRDAARALVVLAREGRAGEIYHIGTGHSRSIREGLETLARISGRQVILDAEARTKPTGPIDSRAEIGKIVRETSWRPIVPFETTLKDLWSSIADEA